ncbi:MAG: peptide chain release factor N(5)-glutamine methyltransferase, partial [Actinobacteria bacterium]|nr:peptide chain release factor N(5)-glutamine methyltransferase [Actinomycetota bacterium]
ARRNAERSGLDVEVHEGDLLSPLPARLRGAVALVVSNPPYVEPAELDGLPAHVRADPVDALLGGTDVHRRLAGEAPAWLAPGGSLVMELGAGQGPAVAGTLEAAGFAEVHVLPDLAGRDRVAVGRLPDAPG